MTIAAGDRREEATLEVVDDSLAEGDERINYIVSAEGYLGGACQMTLGDDDPNGTPAPAISRINPTSGGAGVSVAITGTNFGATKGTSTVTFHGTAAATTSWSATSITAAVPAGATTGNVLVTVGGQASNGLAFMVTPTPAISGLDPTSGEEGTSVVITGSNFGANRRASTVTFHGTAAATTSWSATSITAAVPAGATTGNVVVTVGGVGSNGIAFTVVEADVGITLSCTSRIAEPSGVATILALLDPGDEPGADVTFAITHSGTADEGDDYTVGTLTIEAGQRTGEMDPRLEVVDDTVSEGEERIELTLTAVGYEEASCTIRLEDDEPAISGLEPAAGPVGTSVVITGANFGAALGTSTVSFNGTAATPTSWSATSITAAVPAGAATGNVVVTVNGVASDGAGFTVTGVRVAPRELTIEEGGTGTYTVVLDSKPASAVTVSMFAPAGTDLSVDILPVFTASNWDEPQTVTVTAGEDEDKEDDIDTIAHRTASADSGYHDLTVDGVEVTVTDNDAGAGVRVTPTGLTIEEGEEGTYTVVLNTEPAAGVTVAVTAAGDLTVMPGSLDFTTLDWDTAQEVTVTVGQDDDAEDETETITHAVTSTDTGYSGLAVDGVRVTIADDEGTGGPGGTEELTVSTTRLRITEGNMGKYTVVLNRAPSAGVTVGVSAPSGGDLTVMPATLDFTTLNWDTPQEVRVTAGEDTDLEDEVESITHTITRASSSSSSSLRGALGRQAAFAMAMGSPAPTREYVYLGGRLVAIAQGGAVSEASVVVTIDDDDDPDTPGVPALTNSLRLTEGHTGAYTLELGAAPTAPVTIALSVSRGSDNVADVTVRPTPLTFTTTDWADPQWVTVTVAEDSDTVGETETISHRVTSTDSRYQGIEIASVRVVIRDRNRPTTPPEPPTLPPGTLTASPNPCTIAAGAATCSTTLNWTSMHTTAVQLRRIMGTTNEILVRSGDPNGQTTFSRIDLTASIFYLYDYSDGRRGRQLATATVHGVRPLSIDPTSGEVGTVVTITGSHFGASRGTGANASTVTFNGTAVVSYTVWSDTRIVVLVPAGATSGDVVVTVDGVARTAGAFRVGSEPACTISAAPNPCIIAAGQTTCTSTLTWTSENTTAVRVWTQQQELTPFGYVGGRLTAFTDSDSTSGNMDATIKLAPRIRHKFAVYDHSGGSRGDAEVCSVIVTGDRALSLSPTSGPMGTVVTIMGSRFEASQGTSTLTFGGTAVTPTSWSDTRIVFTVPQNATLGNKSVVVTVATMPRTIGTFSVTPPPTLSLSPTSGPVGTVVTITGSGFDTTQGTVSFNGTTATPTSWSDTRIVVVAPAGATTGHVVVTVAATPRTVGTFTVTPPPTVISPDSGPVGTEVTITGAGFGTQGPGNRGQWLTFNGTRAAPTSWSDTRIVVEVPDGATSGPVARNSIRGGRVELGPFTVTMDPDPDPDPPTITSFTANPTAVDLGEQSTLSWTVSGATGLSIDQGVGSVTPVTSGSKTVTPKMDLVTTTYTLTASDGTGTDTETADVTINAPGITCSADPETVDPGGSSTLSWTATSAKSVSITPDPGGGTPGTSGTKTVTPSSTTTYTFTATGSTNRTATCSVTVTVWAQPTATISASRTTINEGQPVTVSWSSSNAQTTVITGISGIGTVTGNSSGSRDLTPAQGSHTYTITASNPAQPPYPDATARVTVTVRPKPTGEITAKPNPCTIPEGRTSCTSTIKWTSEGTPKLVVRVSHMRARAFASSGPKGSQQAPWIQEDPPNSYIFYLYDYMDRVQGAELYRVTVTGQRPPPPMISVLNPTSGSVGDAVRLTGTSFGGSQGTSTVTFNGVSATATSWSDRTIDVRVPTGATSGSVVVTVGGQASNGVAFTVTVPARPWINDLSPPDGVVGTAVTISGVNFGNTGSVTFNATDGSPSSWSDTSISVEVPGGATSGPVVVRANGQDSNSVQFLVTQLQKEDPECEDEEDCPKDEEEGEDGEDPPPDP